MQQTDREPANRGVLWTSYQQIRADSEALCAPLTVDDYQIQSALECSPPKWHLAHISWFFETFLLRPLLPDYRPFHPRFEYLFNSYYETVGNLHPRAQRGLLSRPTVEEVYAYRAHVDLGMERLIERGEPEQTIALRVALGLNHEQQHQELMYMDIKHNFWSNPLRPIYRTRTPEMAAGRTRTLGWKSVEEGFTEVGHDGNGFAFDNETPRHREWLPAHRLADRLVTNGEFLMFMQDSGYQRPEFWLADGWALLRREAWESPLYWERQDETWMQMTLSGMRPLDPHEPACHVSYYEADAYARWAGARLPREAEMEHRLAQQPPQGHFADQGRLHPRPARDGDQQWLGELWEWTASPYVPYPGFRPLEGSMGEYNGKFMCNQMVLRGGSCVTPAGHFRPSYRNFFYPHERWPFTGFRLAKDS